MNPSERIKKEYRLLALAVVFFLAGAIFFWYDASLPSSKPQSPTGASPQGVSVQSLDPDFANDPPPSRFKTFIYNNNGINGYSTFSVPAVCDAPYIAFLIFPASIDYRGDVTGAVYNDAFPCTSGTPFNLTVATSDIAPAPFGTYYFIVADQGATGAWYNPR